MRETPVIKPRCLACRTARQSALAGLYFALLLALLAVALGACSLDTERLAQARQDIRTICDGAVTVPLRAWCAQIVVPEVPQEAAAE